MEFEVTKEYAQELDNQDELREFRSGFVVEDADTVYLDGNSLGRLPKQSVNLVRDIVENQWGTNLIRSWNEDWFTLSERVGAKIAKLIGAKPNEVIIADSTSVNLFKLVVAALQYQQAKNIVVSDEFNFPSDLYILQGAIRLLGNRHTLRLLQSHDRLTISHDEIKKNVSSEVSLITLSHTAFKSGFVYDMQKVTELAHSVSALVLFDLSHSAGALPVNLNAANIDLAVGCTYKYLNGGPGSPAFLYIREDLQEKLLNPISGWFGQEKQFHFGLEYTPEQGIKKFLTGTPPVLSLAPIEIGVDILLEAGMERLRKKSVAQTEYLISLYKELLKPLAVTFNSPEDDAMRGSHVCLGHPEGFRINQALIKEMKVIPDFRHPDNMRFGITPLYTTYTDIYQAITRLEIVIKQKLYEKYERIYEQVT